MFLRTLFLAVLFVVFPAARINAQQITGRAHASGSDVPVSAAAIVLVNDAGVIVAGTLSAADGSYVLRAPAIAHYRVRARRIGFAPDSADVTLTAGAANFDPALTPLRASLEVVRIEGIQKCEVEHGTGDVAYQLWDAAQNALASTIAAAADKLFIYRLRRFVREVDPASNRTVYGTSAINRSLASEPYHSVSPDSLTTVGFARVEGDSSVYYAPDAYTLTADAFIRTHCLRAVRDTSRPDQLGLAFEPVRRGDVVDVSGVLWIDRASSELRDLQYHYELPRLNRGRARLPAGVNAATGRVEYRRLDDGAWIVNRWIIQVPLQAEQPGYTVGGRNRGASRADVIWEVGGAVVDVLRPDDASATLDEVAGAVEGILVGGPERLPVVGAQVNLNAADATWSASQRTRADGSFAFDSLAPADYVLRMSDLELDTLNITFPPVPVSVRPGTRQTVTVRMPLPYEAREALCGDRDAQRIILHGTVTDSVSGRPVSRARVTATWMERGNDSTPTEVHQRETSTNREGKYVLCDLAAGARLVVAATSDALGGTRDAPFETRRGGTFMMNLVLSPRAPTETVTTAPDSVAQYIVELKSDFDAAVYARLIADRTHGKIGSVQEAAHSFTIYGITDEAVARLVKMPEVSSVKRRAPAGKENGD